MPFLPGSTLRTAHGAARFQTTHWSVVLKAGQGAEEALLKLCRIYWLPLYRFARRRGHAVHEAQDLTQEFFAHILANRGFATVAPERGRFRSFLLVALKHFLDNEWHKKRALKRGGGQQLISWEELSATDRDAIEPLNEGQPDKSYDREWALTLLERAMKRLEIECSAGGKGEQFAALKEHLTDSSTGGGKSYRELGVELGMTEGAVKVTVHRLRRRFGELVREQVERTVASPKEIDDEIRDLFAALS
jgi:RNA polymerase sigma factor (sigma-70 family)